ncbi:LysR substrate-binding domain-containing protein [Pseudohalocynthiibacter aestuariivivens]|uniref:LysR substrate-binding domain-containing protein n=1 Tax=Pseudohalocynthiibacter aestuariivivens TaxID=1591409 RepID=A0ABV5JIJ1_9RHOB|nr:MULTISPECIES: LysR substrate-binding domain-containing protein [Pseudohalocynthiibacter]MBS9716516.1 LysR family transcriptional regulator [Pseudohalocynthiibacter aestuariivivens]MCK0101585.1 LysR substrate-binding domain-containing protein [Pseudohalocynthiibacter sp. F2068]
MRYVQLRAFHHVAIHGGFSRAADALFLTQPAISDQVRKLEEEYDILLFNRKKKQITVTEQGERLLEITKRMFENEAQARELLSENRAFSSGTLRIIVDSASHVLATIAKFREKFPLIKIEIKTGNSEDVIESLYAYQSDIGVLGAAPRNSEIDVVSLGESRIIAFTANSNPLSSHKSLTLGQLSAMPLVLRETGSKTRQKLEAAASKNSVKLVAAIEAEGREAVQEIVASGAGIGFVSEKEFSHDDRLVPIQIKGSPILMEESVVCLRERNGGKLIKAFTAMVQQTAADDGITT